VCGKLKFGSDSDIKKSEPNPNRSKSDICADNFLTETACNLQFELKVTKITSFEFNMQLKKVLKHDQNQV